MKVNTKSFLFLVNKLWNIPAPTPRKLYYQIRVQIFLL